MCGLSLGISENDTEKNSNRRYREKKTKNITPAWNLHGQLYAFFLFIFFSKHRAIDRNSLFLFFYWYFKILLHTGNLIANEINFHAIFHQPKKFIYDNYFNYTNLLHLMKQYDKQTTSFQFFLLFLVFLYHLNMQNKFWRE